MQLGVRLCKGCNSSAPSASIGRELEGFLLATWCMAQIRGEAWMRATMLNKARWRRWRRALRTEERVGGAEGWWWRILQASMPKDELTALQVAEGKMVGEEEWRAWWEGTLWGLQEASLLHEFHEEEPSAFQTGWHRKQLWVMFEAWKEQTPLEAVLSKQDEPTLEEWEARGRVGSSEWRKHRGA